ncbi:MAG: ROK family transcriptional regulator [Gordonia sp. (in: high G+C Gram-positive bacteria)]
MSDVRPGALSALRRRHHEKVLETVAVAGAIHQAEIARISGLSRATVSTIVAELIDTGVVEVALRGRRHMVCLAQQPGFVVAVDYGHRHVTVAIADRDCDVLAGARHDLPEGADADTVLKHARRLFAELLIRTGVGREEIVAAAIGLPAPLDRESWTVGSRGIVTGWQGRNIIELARDALGLDVPWHAENDANLGALAEYRRMAARGDGSVRSLAFIKFGAGLGAGIVLDGRLLTGRDGTAGEIGHLVFDHENGALCRCGNRGCLETRISVPVVAARVADVYGPRSIAEIVALAEGGDELCRRTLVEAGALMGSAVASIANLLNPDVVVIGGEMERAASIVLPAIWDVVRRECIAVAANSLRIVPSDLGSRAQVAGAVLAAVDLVSPVPMFGL